MWRAEWWLIGAGLLGLFAALVWGLADGPDGPVVSLALVSMVVSFAGIAAWWFDERAAGGLDIAPELQPIPGPPWWLPTTVLGVLVGLVGLTTVVWIAVLGALLAVTGLVGLSRAVAVAPTPLDRRTIRLARDVRAARGKESYGFVTSLGTEQERLVFVRGNGTVGDLVLPRPDATRVVELAGLRLVDAASPEAGALRADPAQWRRMADRVLGY